MGDSRQAADGLGQTADGPGQRPDGAAAGNERSGNKRSGGEPEGFRGAADRTPGHFRRLHPLTPLLRGWAFLAAGFAYVGQDALRASDPGRLLIVIPAIAVVGFAFGFASWWFTRYGFDGDDLRIDSGILQRRSRRVRMDRLQAVDVVRPLAGRLLGLSELRMEVAGGGESEAPLAYLSADDAVRLRAELLARSAGIDADTPEAPERLVHQVSLGRLAGSTVLSGAFVMGIVLIVILVGATTAFSLESNSPVTVALPSLVPGFIGVGAALWYQLGRNFGFTLAESPDGFRVRKGLLDTRAQTVPPGRIQGVAIVQPLLWRLRGWVRVDVDVAGYAGSSSGEANTSRLLPVATVPEAIRVLREVLPGAEPAAVELSPVPRRAAWLRPIGWLRLAYGADDRVIVAREGVLYRTLTIVPHAKTQSVRVTQGPVQRLLGLATVLVDTTPGPVDAVIRHRPEEEARAILEAQARRARLARRVDVPERWMAAPRHSVETSDGDGTTAASIDETRSDSVPDDDEGQDPPGHRDSG